MKRTYGKIVLGLLFIVLVWSLVDMPPMGGIDNPSIGEVSDYYISKNKEDTNSANLIASIITDYRAFDTLGETTVLYASITAVISVLGAVSHRRKNKL